MQQSSTPDVGTTADRELVWETLAQVWVDSEYDSAELDLFAAQLAGTRFNLRELDQIAYREVCGAFACDTLLMLLTAGMAMDDWFYPEETARRKVSTWLSRPLLCSWCNPVWIVGYALARWFLGRVWFDLRRKVLIAREGSEFG